MVRLEYIGGLGRSLVVAAVLATVAPAPLAAAGGQRATARESVRKGERDMALVAGGVTLCAIGGAAAAFGTQAFGLGAMAAAQSTLWNDDGETARLVGALLVVGGATSLIGGISLLIMSRGDDKPMRAALVVDPAGARLRLDF